MAVYDLGRLSVLLVEDNNYVRNVFHELLRHFGFGRVMLAKNGAQAVEHIRVPAGGQAIAGVTDVDIIISDLVMSPVDGLLFLKWVRESKDSPNRFAPFIMLSGAADGENVRKARDGGTTEFLAKPFSAEAVYKHILEAIDYPRPFIASRTYFGPDRRRRDTGAPGEERRMTRDSDLTLVYSADKVIKPSKPTDVWKFVLPNRLKDKVGGLGSSTPGEIPNDLLVQAEESLERAALDFTEWAREYLSKLSKQCDLAMQQEPGARRRYFTEINLLAHELRGQGGTFGYPLISVFGKMLYEATGGECREDDNSVEIVRAHIDAMRAVIRDKVSGDGGKLGRELLASLKAAIDRIQMVA